MEGFALEMESRPSSLTILQFIGDIFVKVATCALNNSTFRDADGI